MLFCDINLQAIYDLCSIGFYNLLTKIIMEGEIVILHLKMIHLAKEKFCDYNMKWHFTSMTFHFNVIISSEEEFPVKLVGKCIA